MYIRNVPQSGTDQNEPLGAIKSFFRTTEAEPSSKQRSILRRHTEREAKKKKKRLVFQSHLRFLQGILVGGGKWIRIVPLQSVFQISLPKVISSEQSNSPDEKNLKAS